MQWTILALGVVALIVGMAVSFAAGSFWLGLLILGVLIVFIVIWLMTHSMTTRYLKSSKEYAYRLVKSKNPDTQKIQETINDLSKFPDDQEAKKLIEELTKKRIQS